MISNIPMKLIEELIHKSKSIINEKYSHLTKMHDNDKENFEKYIKNVFKVYLTKT